MKHRLISQGRSIDITILNNYVNNIWQNLTKFAPLLFFIILSGITFKFENFPLDGKMMGNFILNKIRNNFTEYLAQKISSLRIRLSTILCGYYDSMSFVKSQLLKRLQVKKWIITSTSLKNGMKTGRLNRQKSS